MKKSIDDLNGKIIKKVLYLSAVESIVFVFEDDTYLCIQAKPGYYAYDPKLEYGCDLPYELNEYNNYEI
jgi:hypothetical protein